MTFLKNSKAFRILNFYNLVVHMLKLQLARVHDFISSTEEHSATFQAVLSINFNMQLDGFSIQSKCLKFSVDTHTNVPQT